MKQLLKKAQKVMAIETFKRLWQSDKKTILAAAGGAVLATAGAFIFRRKELLRLKSGK